MSKKKMSANRKCSAILAAGAGAAICLTGGGKALAANGLVADSNGGTANFSIVYTASRYVNLFNYKVSVAFLLIGAPLYSTANIRAGGSGTSFKASLNVISNLPSGVTISSALGGFDTAADLPLGVVFDRYYAFRFQDTGTKFGWVHVDFEGTFSITMDTWSYETSGGAIATLSESVTTTRLALTDGKEKLHWTNDNEDGVARYEVQSKDASGNWIANDSDVPGNGTYSAKVAAGATSRLIVEMTDGTTKQIDF